MASIRSFLLLLSFLICCSAGAQQVLKGRVVDAAATPFYLATVELYQQNDSAILKTVFTDTLGYFMFKNLSPGLYQVKVSALGYKIVVLDSLSPYGESTPAELTQIQLKESAKVQDGVVVTSRPKAFIERKLDKTVVNVDALISNAGTTALDVLSKSPGVITGQNGNISLKGKSGVLILIDNKQTYLAGQELENFLNSIPSSQLDQIEIMTNPPARYDAAGNAGVINIKTKRIKSKGFNGNASAAVDRGRLTRSNNSLNLNYRNNKFTLSGNFGLGFRNRFADIDFDRTFKNTNGTTRSLFNQDYSNRGRGTLYNVKAGADYYWSEKTVVGLQYTSLFWDGRDKDLSDSYFFTGTGAPYLQVNADNSMKSSIKNQGINLNLRQNFGKAGQELTADGDYIRYRNKVTQNFRNLLYETGNPVVKKDSLTGNMPSDIDIYVASLNYTTPLAKTFKLEVGGKTSYIVTNNVADFRNVVNNISTPDYDKSNEFKYKENIQAGYINLSREWDRVSLQAGLRFEDTRNNGRQLGNAVKPDSTFKQNYNGWFPTFFMSWKADTLGKHQLGINYGRRIDRPFFQDLNPFLFPIDKYTFNVGNPFLRPAFTNSMELSYTYNSNWTLTAAWSRSVNEVNETIEIRDTIYYNRPANIGKKRTLSLSLDGTLQLGKKLNLVFSGMVADIKANTSFYTGLLNTQGTYVMVRPVLQATFKKGWNAELSGSYTSDIVDVQFITRGFGVVSAAVQKKINTALTAKLSFNDIFFTTVNKGIVTNLALTDATYFSLMDTRKVIFSLSYRFGKATGALKKHEANAAENERGRIK